LDCTGRTGRAKIKKMEVNYKLESLVNKDCIVMMQLKGEGHVVGFASFGLDVAREFLGSMLILKDKLNAAGLVDLPDDEVMPLPTDATMWQ
jgi:hypothetical protein